MKQALADEPEAAEALAIQALAFIAGDAERLGRFLAVTGIGPERFARPRASRVSRRRARPYCSATSVCCAPLRTQSGDRSGRGRAGRGALGGTPMGARCAVTASFCRDCLADARADGRALPGLRLAAAGAPCRARRARHRPCRLRRLLRHDREARRSLARRQAGDRRRRQARRGGHRLLCRAHLRRAVGDADVRGAAASARTRRGPAGHGEICQRRPRGAPAMLDSRRWSSRSRSTRPSSTCPAPQRLHGMTPGAGAGALCRDGRARASASPSRSACPATSSSPRSPPTSTSRAALPCSAQAEAAAFLAPKPVELHLRRRQGERGALRARRLSPHRRSAAAERARPDAPLRRRRPRGSARLARGIDARDVDADRETKSVSAETTFEHDISRFRPLERICGR